MRIASIDVGSNTVLLLIAEIRNGKLFTILNLYRAPRLSKGLNDSNFINHNAVERLLAVLKEYKEVIDKYNCSAVLIKATAALRKAENRNSIIKTVEDKLSLKIDIISGQEEAELSYLGALSDFEEDNSYSVIDIGGGSTEIIYGRKDKIDYKFSFPFGAVILKEKYISEYPVSEDEISNISTFLKYHFSKLHERINGKDLLPIAVAGTPTSLSALNLGLNEYNEDIIEKSLLRKSDIERLISYFAHTTPSILIKKHKHMLEGREDIILTGSLILKGFMDALELDEIFVSSRGVRYGIIIDYMNNLKRK